MKWFGRSWDAPVCDPKNHVYVYLAGASCFHCRKDIVEGDRGFVVPFGGDVAGVNSKCVYYDNIPHFIYHKKCFFTELGITK